MTVTDSSVIALPMKEYPFHPEAYSSLNQQLAEEYIRNNNHIATLNKTRAIVKVATFILDISKRLNIDKTDSHGFQFPRTDMANYLGLSVETVCREIKQLKEHKAIEIKKTRIIIYDAKQLTDIIKQ